MFKHITKTKLKILQIQKQSKAYRLKLLQIQKAHTIFNFKLSIDMNLNYFI